MKFASYISSALFIFTLFSASEVKAGLITHNHYNRDSASDVIQGRNLEWLKWDNQIFFGTLETTLSYYRTQGWRLASNTEAATLLNDFFSSDYVNFTADENTHQEFAIDGDQQLSALIGSTTDDASMFLKLFGFTTIDFGYGDPMESIFAVVGNDEDQDNLFSAIAVTDEHLRYSPWGPMMAYGKASLSADYYNLSDITYATPLALVRDTVNNVSTPPALATFVLAFVALVFARRKTSPLR